MIRTDSIFACALLLSTFGCSAVSPKPAPAVDCSVVAPYEFGPVPIDDFSGPLQWFQFADNTPGGVPDFSPTNRSPTSNILPPQVDPPGRCGDTSMIELRAYGHNFYGAGFGDYGHQPKLSRANGTGYEGISFWARSAGNTDTTFMFFVDDGRTIVMPPPPPPPPDAGASDAPALPKATVADQDLDGDGFVGPGDIVGGTDCRLPPPQALGTPACYSGGVLPPGTPPRIPAPNECGNPFHLYITTTKNWQLFLIPWDQLAQWPCANRLPGGINPADIAQVEIKVLQGTDYDIWLDNIEFYRRRADAGP